MKRNGKKKLTLRAETLRTLQDPSLKSLVGGTFVGCVSRLMACDNTAQETCGQTAELCG